MKNNSGFLLLALSLLCLRAEASFNDVSSGTLLLDFASGSGAQWVAPGLAADVDIQVTGPIVRATVTQTFQNPGSEWANATYVFPLPETAAVDHMKLIVGERIIEGQIKEKDEARKIYEQAKKQGRKASLVSQQRRNLFTTRVANIPPGEKIKVTIQYQHPVDKDGDIYSLRFPMTITPRYIPGKAITRRSRATPTGDGWSPDTDEVPDASDITPPWSLQGRNNHPTRIVVNLDPGFELANTTSLYHTVTRQSAGGDNLILTLSEQDHQANADFVVQWRPAESGQPQVAAFTEMAGEERYSLLMFTPPAKELAGPPPAREVIFVIDTSGSMGGESMRQAKQALLWALDRLRPQDSFNVIEFNSGSWALYNTARLADSSNVRQARQFVAQLQARGGTEMMGAMDMALCEYCFDDEKLRQVIFLTDGAIGNEEQLFQLVQTKLAASRLFTVGIGSAPNSFFMRKAAEIGKGSYTYIANINEAGATMAQLFATLEAPMLTHLNLDVDGQPLDIFPNPAPDIYAGKPLVVVMKGNLPDEIRLSGQLADSSWRLTVPASSFRERPGVGVLYGRQQIDVLMNRYRFTYDPTGKESLKQTITSLAIKHHLVSQFTSLVAVDITPSKKPTTPSRGHKIANNSPRGTTFGLAQTATPATEKLITGLLLALIALLLIWWQARADRRAEARQDAVIQSICRTGK